MKKIFEILLFAVLLLMLSCNKDEGPGGSSSVEGYVYQIRHWDVDYSYILDTIPAVDVRVQLTYGDNYEDFYGDDTRTDGKGLYGFDYLREGNYLVSSYTELLDGQLQSVYASAKVKGKTTKADTLFIRTIVKKGFATIKGNVTAHYYDKNVKVAEGPAMEKRVFINVYGAETFFDDVRVGDQGVFAFSEILPGKYEVWVTTEDPITEKLSVVKQVIEVTGKEGVYELGETFVVKVSV
jgi:hypothetical protein